MLRYWVFDFFFESYLIIDRMACSMRAEILSNHRYACQSINLAEISSQLHFSAPIRIRWTRSDALQYFWWIRLNFSQPFYVNTCDLISELDRFVVKRYALNCIIFEFYGKLNVFIEWQSCQLIYCQIALNSRPHGDKENWRELHARHIHR